MGRVLPRECVEADVRFSVAIAQSRRSAFGPPRSFGGGRRKVKLGSSVARCRTVESSRCRAMGILTSVRRDFARREALVARAARNPLVERAPLDVGRRPRPSLDRVAPAGAMTNGARAWHVVKSKG